MEANYFAILYWFCHTSTWIHHGYTCAPHPEAPSHLPPCTIPLGHPSAPAPSIQYRALTWTGDSFHIWYYTCFNAILPYHPALTLSHRVQKTVLYICVSFAVSLLFTAICKASSDSHVAFFFFFCISFSWGWSWSLSPVQCHKPLTIVHQALCLSDLVP